MTPGPQPAPLIFLQRGPFFNPTATSLFPCVGNGQLDQREVGSPHWVWRGAGQGHPGTVGPEGPWPQVDSSLNGQEEQQCGVRGVWDS